jgi:hypothetical protein
MKRYIVSVKTRDWDMENEFFWHGNSFGCRMFRGKMKYYKANEFGFNNKNETIEEIPKSEYDEMLGQYFKTFGHTGEGGAQLNGRGYNYL